MNRENITSVGKEVFRKYYEEGDSAWGNSSGSGSDSYFTTDYRAFIDKFMRMNGVKKIVDIGCGDWQFSRFLNLNHIDYLGLDVVPSVIERNTNLFASKSVRFQLMPDQISDVPSGDLLLMKDVLQHLPNQDIFDFAEQVFPKFKFCILTNSFVKLNTPRNTNIKHGEFRCLDLSDEPFFLEDIMYSNFAALCGNEFEPSFIRIHQLSLLRATKYFRYRTS